MKISATYITKNEEKKIEKSILSLKKIADEIIVVDTGSTDNTKEICKKLGCTVYDYVWENDFSKARNYALNFCKGDIVIFLDADEYFEPELNSEDKINIEKIFVENNADILCIKATDINIIEEKVIHTSHMAKIFKNNPNIKYVNSIHETIANTENFKIIGTDVVSIIHTGYSSDIVESKVKRNVELLEKIKDKKTMDYFYLGRENLSLGNIEEAEKYFKIFFDCKNYYEEVSNNNLAYMAYLYMFEIMLKVKRYNCQDKKNWIDKMLEEIPHIPEVYYRVGQFYYNYDFDKSYKYFMKAIKQNEDFVKSNRIELNTFPSYEAEIYSYLSKIFMFKNDNKKATEEIIVACLLDRKNKRYANVLFNLLDRNTTEENINLIKKVYCPRTIESYMFLLEILDTTDLYQEFITLCLELNTTFNVVNEYILKASLLEENYLVAAKFLHYFKDENSNLLKNVCAIYSNFNPCFKDVLTEQEQTFIITNYLKDGEMDKSYEASKLIYGLTFCLIKMGIDDIPKRIFKYIYDTCGYEKYIKNFINYYENNNRFDKAYELWKEVVRFPNKEEIKDLMYILYSLDSNEFVKRYYTLITPEKFGEGYMFNLLNNTDGLTKENFKLKKKILQGGKNCAKA